MDLDVKGGGKLCEDVYREFGLIPHSASELEDGEVCTLLSENRENVVFIIDKGLPSHGDLSSLLHISVAASYPKTAAWLLENKASPNVRNHDNETPLHLACTESPNSDILSSLLNAKADVDQLSNQGESAYERAIRKGYSAVEEALAPHSSPKNRQRADVKLVMKLESEGASKMEVIRKAFKDLANPHNQHLICRTLKDNQQLIEKGFLKINYDPASNGSYLHQASTFCAHKVVEAVIASKANPNALDAKGLSALHLACIEFRRGSQGAQSTIRVLLAADADMSQGEYQGDKTPMDFLDDEEKREWLLDAMANTGGVDDSEYLETKMPMVNLRTAERCLIDATKESVTKIMSDVLTDPTISGFSEQRDAVEKKIAPELDAILTTLACGKDTLTIDQLKDYYQFVRNTEVPVPKLREAVKYVQADGYDPKNTAVLKKDFLFVLQAVEVVMSRSIGLAWGAKLLDSKGDGWIPIDHAKLLWDKNSLGGKAPQFKKFVAKREELNTLPVGQDIVNPLRQLNIHKRELCSLAFIEPDPEKHY